MNIYHFLPQQQFDQLYKENELDLETISKESKTLYEAIVLTKTYRKDVDQL